MLETAATSRFAAANVHIPVVGRGSYLHGIPLPQVSSSRLTVLDDVCEIHRRTVSKIMCSIRSSIPTTFCWPWFVFLRCRVLSGIGKQVTRPSPFLKFIAAGVEHYIIHTKLYSSHLLFVMPRLCTVQGYLRYHQAGYPSLKIFEIYRRSVSGIMLSIRSSILTSFCCSWFVVVRCRVLSGIVKQVTRP